MKKSEMEGTQKKTKHVIEHIETHFYKLKMNSSKSSSEREREREREGEYQAGAPDEGSVCSCRSAAGQLLAQLSS